MVGDGEDVELSLLGEEERQQAALGSELEENGPRPKPSISLRDKKAMALLCLLYLIQGVPLGLSLGSVPVLLKDHLSYSQLATFSLSTYPYSLKLLWSPIVDAVYLPSVGRRKSWIIPMQLAVGSVMLYISLNVQRLMEYPSNHVNELTFLFTLLVFLSATQDIAVDGWALTLLSQENLPYASTCQTIGLSIGYFVSFTIFLAFNSVEFAHKWHLPQLTLSAYLRFWSIVCLGVTTWLTFFKKEDNRLSSTETLSTKDVYKTIWSICKVPHIKLLIIVHLFAKVGFAANDGATGLKMLEKGFKREELAVVALVDFPFQIIGGYLVGKWSRGDRPLRPWVLAFWPRLGFCLLATMIVYYFPKPPIPTGFFALLVIFAVASGLTTTTQFVGISAFHTRISDPVIGGTYMTLLNTFTNLGGTWPDWFVLRGVDFFTVAKCKFPSTSLELASKVSECVSERGKKICKDAAGECIIETDGYYVMSALCMTFGVVFLVGFIIPTVRKLEKLPPSPWQIKSSLP